jgi:predicted metal-binding membrane protein
MAGLAGPIEAVIRRDRLIVLAAVLAIAALAWAYLVRMAHDMAAPMATMPDMPDMVMPGVAPPAWDAGYLAMLVVMWAVMMVGMMLPSAAPVILLQAAIDRRRQPAATPYAATTLFALGYLATWTGFSLIAALAQWALAGLGLLSGAMATTSAILGGLLLAAAGAYQLSPLKDVCLSRCRSPVHFLVHRRRVGPLGPLRMGLEHGAYCVGCCWLLMALLFVLGVMNLLWVATLAAFTLIEKVVPRGDLLGRAAGVLMLASGGLLLARAATA